MPLVSEKDRGGFLANLMFFLTNIVAKKDPEVEPTVLEMLSGKEKLLKEVKKTHPSRKNIDIIVTKLHKFVEKGDYDISLQFLLETNGKWYVRTHDQGPKKNYGECHQGSWSACCEHVGKMKGKQAENCYHKHKITWDCLPLLINRVFDLRISCEILTTQNFFTNRGEYNDVKGYYDSLDDDWYYDKNSYILWRTLRWGFGVKQPLICYGPVLSAENKLDPRKRFDHLVHDGTGIVISGIEEKRNDFEHTYDNMLKSHPVFSDALAEFVRDVKDIYAGKYATAEQELDGILEVAASDDETDSDDIQEEFIPVEPPIQTQSYASSAKKVVEKPVARKAAPAKVDPTPAEIVKAPAEKKTAPVSVEVVKAPIARKAVPIKAPVEKVEPAPQSYCLPSEHLGNPFYGNPFGNFSGFAPYSGFTGVNNTDEIDESKLRVTMEDNTMLREMFLVFSFYDWLTGIDKSDGKIYLDTTNCQEYIKAIIEILKKLPTVIGNEEEMRYDTPDEILMYADGEKSKNPRVFTCTTSIREVDTCIYSTKFFLEQIGNLRRYNRTGYIFLTKNYLNSLSGFGKSVNQTFEFARQEVVRLEKAKSRSSSTDTEPP